MSCHGRTKPAASRFGTGLSYSCEIDPIRIYGWKTGRIPQLLSEYTDIDKTTRIWEKRLKE